VAASAAGASLAPPSAVVRANRLGTRISSRFVVPIVAATLLFLAACRTGSGHAPAIGQAYVGPAILKIRADLPVQSATVATVQHGDRLEILQRRRIFLRVRTASGAEGWTEARQLLSASDMASLKELSTRAAAMPAQGQAICYNDLNVHTRPSRQAPSFLQIKAKEKFDVLGHVVTPRSTPPRAPLISPAPKKAPAEKKDTGSRSKLPPPPMPKPPGPPSNWLELSKPGRGGETAEHEEPPANKQEAKAEDKPVPTDDWSLVRVPGGQTGWALTGRISMAIPDEVAQYAEGHRIVSYFSLGKTGDENKDIWLWTTTADAGHPYDFDSFRVFNWSVRHHRYETAHIERNLKGYAPVLLTNVEYAAGNRGKGQSAGTKYPGFSVCVENRAGQRVRRSYALLGNIVRFSGEQPCGPPTPVYLPPPEGSFAAMPPVAAQTPPAGQPGESFLQHWKRRLKALVHR
jgi:hypothetical protein